jgi:hypothetical protein
MRTTLLARVFPAVFVFIACGPPPTMPSDDPTMPGPPQPLPAPKPLPTRAAKTKVGQPVGPEVVLTTGPMGGVLVTPDERLTLRVPAGAVPVGTRITARPITNHVPGGFGIGYRLTKPDAVSFAQPVTLTLRYTDFDVEGTSTRAFGIGRQRADTTWEVFTPTVDTTGKTLTVTTTGFSDWAPFTGHQLVPKQFTVRTNQSRKLTVVYCHRERYPQDDGSPGDVERIAECVENHEGMNPVWKVNGAERGNTTVGRISASNNYAATFTAPSMVPKPDTVEVAVEFTQTIVSTFKDILIARATIEDSAGYRGAFRVNGSIPFDPLQFETITMEANGELRFDRTYNDQFSANFELDTSRTLVNVVSWSLTGLNRNCKRRGAIRIVPSNAEGLIGAMDMTRDPAEYTFNVTVALRVPAECTYTSGNTEEVVFEGLGLVLGTEAPGRPRTLPVDDPLYLEQKSYVLDAVSGGTYVQDWGLIRTFQ